MRENLHLKLSKSNFWEIDILIILFAKIFGNDAINAEKINWKKSTNFKEK